MNKSGVVPIALSAILLSTACSTAASVDMSESLRVLGTENGIRIDAQLETNEFAPSSLVTIVYEIENRGESAIVFADTVPTIEYLADERLITVTVGAEIPHDDALPKLMTIAPGETRAFTAGARLGIASARVERLAPRYLRVKLSYLDGAGPFERYLDDASPQADENLFRTWVDHIGAVMTNALPIRWRGGDADPIAGANLQMPLIMP